MSLGILTLIDVSNIQKNYATLFSSDSIAKSGYYPLLLPQAGLGVPNELVEEFLRVSKRNITQAVCNRP